MSSEVGSFKPEIWRATFKRMTRCLVLLLACGAIGLTGCGPSLHTEQRVIELPANDPTATLSRASQIGQALIGAGFFAEVRKRFPEMTEEQFQGLFLSWNSGLIRGRERVFLLTGVRYHGQMPASKAVADGCESLVKAAVTDAFPTSNDPSVRTRPTGE